MSRKKKKNTIYLDGTDYDSFLNQISTDEVASVDSKYNEVLSAEDNRSWIDKLADKINAFQKNRDNMTEAERLHEDYSAYAEGNNSGDVTGIGSWWKSKTGKGLTNAELATNAFNAWQAQEARDFDERMANTQYQRTVSDMQAAGINPALAMTNSINAAPSSPSAQATSPGATGDFGIGGLFGSIVSLMKGVKEMKLLSSQEKLNLANAKKAEADAAKTEKDTAWIDRLNQAEVESKNAGTRLTDQQYENAKEQKNQIIAETEKAKAEARTEAERRMLVVAEKQLKETQVTEINTLLPYRTAYMEAQTDTERAQAAYLAAQTAYQNKLTNSGYIDKMVDEMDAHIQVLKEQKFLTAEETKKVKEEIKKIGEDIKTAKKINQIRFDGLDSKNIGEILLSFLSMLSIGVLGK